MTPGEVYWVELPLANGHEQAGRRPAVVMQDDAAAAHSPMVFVVPLTTAAAATRYPGVVPVPATQENGLRADSFALVFQFRAVDRRRLRDRIGTVAADQVAALFAALDGLTGRRRES
ncbi:MAG TPA: type II toxin-antitoxin system PemK/MazF family toxin [Gemmataceae bacterium]|jgi:mRNA interferase MazF